MSKNSISTTSPLPDTAALAQLCKACAEPLRVDIVRLLHNNSYSVQELCQITDLKQSAVTHHLKVLATAQLLTTRREGNTLFYRRKLWPYDHNLADLQQSLFASIDQCVLDEALQAGVAHVELQRLASSNAFFIDNSDKFRQQQDLIANFDQYAESVATMLKTVALPGQDVAIEIGPGEGLFLPYLAPMFNQVFVFDTSMAMLLQCERYIRQQKFDNVQAILGDSRVALKQKIQADAIIINMVLHHIAAPYEVFADSYRLLKPGGALLITELCHHDQSWAKDACGDVWLGFEPEDLSQWAQSVGLLEGQSSYLAQRNGFRIQIRHFYKPLEQAED